MDEHRNKMLLCPIRAFKRYLSRPESSTLFISTIKQKRVQSTNLFWIRLVISYTYQSRLRLTWYRRLVALFSSERTVQSNRCWKLGCGLHKLLPQFSIFKMSPTGIRTPFILYWLCGDSSAGCIACNPHSLVVVTLVPVFRGGVCVCILPLLFHRDLWWLLHTLIFATRELQ